MKNRSLNSQKGITLIALIVTAIVLLILCGITISAVIGDKGLIKETKSAVKDWEKSDERHRIESAVINSMRRGKALNYDKFNSELSKHFDDYTLVKDGDNFKLTLNGTEYTLNEEGNITKEGLSGSVEGGELGGGSGGETGGNDETLTLTAPVLSIDGDKLVITKGSSETESYEIIINGESKGTVPATGTTTEYDLSTLTDGEYTIEVIAKADGASDSPKANTTYTVEAVQRLSVKTYNFLPESQNKVVTLILVEGPAVNGYDYNGDKMYKVEAYDFAYAYLVEGTVSSSDAELRVSESSDSTTTIIYNTYDINGTGVIDVNDYSTTNGCAYGNYSLLIYMDKYLRADVNGDKSLDSSDASEVKEYVESLS